MCKRVHAMKKDVIGSIEKWDLVQTGIMKCKKLNTTNAGGDNNPFCNSEVNMTNANPECPEGIMS